MILMIKSFVICYLNANRGQMVPGIDKYRLILQFLRNFSDICQLE